MIILPMLLLIRILANSILRFHITGPGTRLNLRSKIKSINQSSLKKYGFSLSKAEFMDGLCLRYGWMPPRLPTHCSCGRDNGIDHALSCPLGGFTFIRHNEIRDVTASLLQETCHNVSIEPLLNGATAVGRRVFTAILPGVSLPPYLSTISTAAVVSSTSFSRVKLRMKTSKKKIA